jgi:hypothetical protein
VIAAPLDVEPGNKLGKEIASDLVTPASTSGAGVLQTCSLNLGSEITKPMPVEWSKTTSSPGRSINLDFAALDSNMAHELHNKDSTKAVRVDGYFIWNSNKSGNAI